jgi:hypothetical protein
VAKLVVLAERQRKRDREQVGARREIEPFLQCDLGVRWYSFAGWMQKEICGGLLDGFLYAES